MLWPGVTGQFMRYLPVTVFAVLAGSLLYALVFAPVLAALFGHVQSGAKTHCRRQIKDKTTGACLVFGGYGRLLSFSTRHPLSVLAVTVVTLYLIVRAYGSSGLGAQFFVDVDLALRGGGCEGEFSAEEIRALVTGVEQRVVEAGEMRVSTLGGQR